MPEETITPTAPAQPKLPKFFRALVDTYERPNLRPVDRFPALRMALEGLVKGRLHTHHKVVNLRALNISSALNQLIYEEKLTGSFTKGAHALRLTANKVVHESYQPSEGEERAAIKALRELTLAIGQAFPEPMVAWLEAQTAPVITPEEEEDNVEAVEAIQAVEEPLAAFVEVYEAITPERTPETAPAFTTSTTTTSSPLTFLNGVIRGRDSKGRLVVGLKQVGELGETLVVVAWPTYIDDNTGHSNPHAERARVCFKTGWPVGLIRPNEEVMQLNDAGQQVRVLYPAHLVLAPDYLVNVTTIAECIDVQGSYAHRALQSLFWPNETSTKMQLGNAVNLLLDELVARGSESVESLRSLTEFDVRKFAAEKLFPSDPLTYSHLFGTNRALSPETATTELMTFLDELKAHARTLTAIIQQRFAETSTIGYQRPPAVLEAISLETSFLSPYYGLRGRLDMLHERAGRMDLVELKSGKVPGYGAWPNHGAQAQAYGLLIEHIRAGKPSFTSLLYSSAAPNNALRHQPRSPKVFEQIIGVRNEIVANALRIATAQTVIEVGEVLKPVFAPTPEGLAAFNREKALAAQAVWQQLDKLAKAYFLENTRFIARELLEEKMGGAGTLGGGMSEDLRERGEDTRGGGLGIARYSSDAARERLGFAALWRTDAQRKKAMYVRLDGLTMAFEDADGEATSPFTPEGETGFELRLKRPPLTDANNDALLVRFRAGDWLLLFPTHNADGQPIALPIDAQLLQAELVEITDTELLLTLGSRQVDEDHFKGYSQWALEPNSLDGSTERQYGALWSFLGAPGRVRSLILGGQPPAAPRFFGDSDLPTNPHQNPESRTLNPRSSVSTPEQAVDAALAAPDYFLVGGPPGTGKTREVIRRLMQRLVSEGKRVLVAAYTHRAVDELTEQALAVEFEGGKTFARIGGRLSCDKEYRHLLLSERVKGLKTRGEVQDYLGSCQMVLGTVASLVGSQREQLMGLFAFDVVIIDEASQLLDAMVLPLLLAVPKWIMVGDHRQLSAVVTQPVQDSEVITKELRALGFSNWRLSLFERLYLRAEREGWTHAYTLLRYQGRMHTDIGSQASGLFYANQLECLPETTERGLAQRSPLARNPAHFPPTTELHHRLMSERMVFVPVPEGLTPAERGTQAKTSLWEAQQVAALAVWYVQGMLAEGTFEAGKSIGIIAPFRNQVALIKQWLINYAALTKGEALLRAVDTITVDTVERYQGSQRDVILVSFAVQHAYQLGLITSLSDTEPMLCRKLNVAITRAREQLVMFGDAEVLRLEPAYARVVGGL